jgi:hypothetical protein
MTSPTLLPDPRQVEVVRVAPSDTCVTVVMLAHATSSRCPSVEGGVQHRAAPQRRALSHPSRLRPVNSNIAVSLILPGHHEG